LGGGSDSGVLLEGNDEGIACDIGVFMILSKAREITRGFVSSRESDAWRKGDLRSCARRDRETAEMNLIDCGHSLRNPGIRGWSPAFRRPVDPLIEDRLKAGLQRERVVSPVGVLPSGGPLGKQ
jgi:hypothetical protein